MLYDREHVYQLAETEVRTIVELGKFRVIGTHDLAGHSYGSHEDAERDIRSLVNQGLAQKGTFEGPESTPRELLTLTRGGHRLLRASRLVPDDQVIHSGFVKPKDADHDADLYLLYQKEAHRIEKEGGRNLRVLLDYELKRRINRDIARFGVTARPEIAQRHGLRVVHNKIPVPDMRIEYETREGEIARVNLELVTEHYGGRQAAEKMLAGFSLYTRHGEADRLRRVLDQRELTAEILSL
jgi:ribosomal protein S25